MIKFSVIQVMLMFTYFSASLAQGLSAIAILAPIALAFNIKDFKRVRLNKLLIYLFTFGVFVSLAWLIYDQYTQIYFSVNGFIRQYSSLAIGLAIYIFLMTIKKKNIILRNREIILFIIFLVVPCITQIGGRLQGLTTEPSHFVQLLIYIGLPIIYISNSSAAIKKISYAVIMTLIVLTFSSTGYAELLMAVVFASFSLGKLKRILSISVLIIILFFAFIYFFKDSYVYVVIDSLWNSYMNDDLYSVTFADRFYGFTAPVKYIFENYHVFGRGLGSEFYLYDKIIPNQYLAEISDVKKYYSFPSLHGKLFYSLGPAYLVVLVLIFLQILKFRSEKLKGNDFGFFDHFTLIGLPFSLAVASIFTFGIFAFPVIWFWLAKYKQIVEIACSRKNLKQNLDQKIEPINNHLKFRSFKSVSAISGAQSL